MKWKHFRVRRKCDVSLTFAWTTAKQTDKFRWLFDSLTLLKCHQNGYFLCMIGVALCTVDISRSNVMWNWTLYEGDIAKILGEWILERYTILRPPWVLWWKISGYIESVRYKRVLCVCNTASYKVIMVCDYHGSYYCGDWKDRKDFLISTL